MPLVPYMIGQKLTSASFNNALDIDRTVYQLSDQVVVSSTTLVNSTNLSLSVAANSWYIIMAFIDYMSTTTADIRLNFAGPAGNTCRLASWSLPITETVANGSLQRDAVDNTVFGSGGIGSATMMTANPEGVIATLGTAGTLTIQFAQWASIANNTTLRAGSWMRLIKVV